MPGGPELDAIFDEVTAAAASDAQAPSPEPVEVPSKRPPNGPSSGRFNIANPNSGTFNAARPQPKRGRILPAAAAGLLLLVGGSAFLLRSSISELLHPTPKVASPQLGAAIQAVVPRWRLAFMDLSGSAREHLEQGNAKLAEDTPTAYTEAEESFQKALVLDPSSDDAVAGYVQAIALGHGAQMGNATYQEAVGLIEAAEQRSKGKPHTLIAHANLLLTRTDSREMLLQARGLAQQALANAKPEERSEALLALGLTYLETSAQLATQNFDEALKVTPPPKRAYYYRGLANEIAGEYRRAIDDLKKRLSQDPDQADAMAALARIYEEVGEIGEAKALYLKARERHPDDARNAIMLAALAYQLEDKAKEAVASLRALLKDPGTASLETQAEAWVHLAAAERLAGNLDAANAAAEQALKLPGTGRAARLQLFLQALERNRPEQAAVQREYLGGQAISPALIKLLEGRLLFKQGKAAEAQQAFDAAVQLEPRHLDAKIYSAVAAARAGKREEALRLIFEAMQEDPSRLGPRPVLTLYFLQPGDTLEGADGVFLKLSHDASDPVPLIAEGFVRFHQGDLAGADKLMRQVLEVNENALAAAYRALVALERNDRHAALTAAERAVNAGRQQALPHYVLGQAYAVDGQLEPAKRELRAARDMAPGFLAAELHLARLEAQGHTPEAVEAARARLVRVVGLDPSYLPAKRALYALER